MGRWLTEWVTDFAARTPGAVPTATLFPEPDVVDYLGAAVAAGARLVKVHVQVGGFDPRDPLLRPAWGLLAEAGVPAVVHCGNGPAARRAHRTGRLRRGAGRAPAPAGGARARRVCPTSWARSTSCTATSACTWTRRWSASRSAASYGPLPDDWPARLVAVADRVVLGTDFPNIPYAYAEQLRAIAGWAAADERLGAPFLRSVLHDAPARLLGEPG